MWLLVFFFRATWTIFIQMTIHQKNNCGSLPGRMLRLQRRDCTHLKRPWPPSFLFVNFHSRSALESLGPTVRGGGNQSTASCHEIRTHLNNLEMHGQTRHNNHQSCGINIHRQELTLAKTALRKRVPWWKSRSTAENQLSCPPRFWIGRTPLVRRKHHPQDGTFLCSCLWAGVTVQLLWVFLRQCLPRACWAMVLVDSPSCYRPRLKREHESILRAPGLNYSWPLLDQWVQSRGLRRRRLTHRRRSTQHPMEAMPLAAAPWSRYFLQWNCKT